jgi:Ca-activated chloride channel family protein
VATLNRRRVLQLLALPAFTAAGSAQDVTITVNVRLMLLHASVRDSQGRPVSGLRREAFRITENGRPQEIREFSQEDIPVALGLVIDNSGSMRTNRPGVIAAATALARASNPADELFTVGFNERISPGLWGISPSDQNLAQLEAALQSTPASGKTALYDAIHYALGRIEQAGREKRVLVVITDGSDTASGITLDRLLVEVALSQATIYTVGIFDPDDEGTNPKVLRRLARESGGETFLPRNEPDLARMCGEIARDIRGQYMLGYYSSAPGEGPRYRAVKVSLTGQDCARCRVRARAGFLDAPPRTRPAAGKRGNDAPENQ